MIKNYCQLCGGQLKPGRSQPYICESCGNKSFKNAVPTTEIALFDDKGRVLLAKRGINPNKGKYDLPGGFVELLEPVEDALRRELKEELNLSSEDYTDPNFACSWNALYKYSKEEVVTLNMVFAAKILKQPEQIVVMDDVAEILFVSLDELQNIEFSYKDYPKIIRHAAKVAGIIKSN